MRKYLFVFILVALLFPAAAYAICGDGTIDEKKGENCDPRAKVANGGCDSGYICAPSVCQCVIDYGSRSQQGDTSKRKIVKKK